MEQLGTVEDSEFIEELTKIAQLYIERDQLDEAAHVMSMAEQFERRLEEIDHKRKRRRRDFRTDRSA